MGEGGRGRILILVGVKVPKLPLLKENLNLVVRCRITTLYASKNLKYWQNGQWQIFGHEYRLPSLIILRQFFPSNYFTHYM